MASRRRIPLPLVLAAALLAAAPSASRASRALVGAPLDPSHSFAVGICQTQTSCTLDSPSCSGTLVAPNLVLTARHCVDFGRQLAESFCEVSFLGIIAPAETFVTVHPDPYASGATPDWIPAAAILVPDDPRVCAGDLALIVLERSVSAADATPAWVDVETNLAEAPLAEVAIVGRGWLDGALVSPMEGVYEPVVVDDGGLRRRYLEHVPVLCASDVDGGCTLEDSSDPSGLFTAAADTLLVGGSTLPGDSGAGFVDQPGFTAGRPRVVAVSSFGTWDGAGRPNGAGAVRVARQKRFLVAGAMEAASRAGIPPPEWTRSAFEPPPLDGWGCTTAPESLAPPLALAPLLVLLARSRRRPGAVCPPRTT